MCIKKSLIESKDIAKLQWKPFVAALALLSCIFLASHYIPTGIITWIITLPPLLTVTLISLARANEIGPDKMGFLWQSRRVAFMCTGASAVMYLGAPFTDTPMFPSWKAVLMIWGVAGVWVTTPSGIPFWAYLTGEWKMPRADGKKFSHIAHLTGRQTADIKIEELNKRLDEQGEL